MGHARQHLKQPVNHNHDLDVDNVRISQHAREQFAARGAKCRDSAHADQRLKRNLIRAREVIRKNAKTNLLKYGIKPTRYFWRHGWVYVVVEDTLTTCYLGQQKNFLRMDGTDL